MKQSLLILLVLTAFASCETNDKKASEPLSEEENKAARDSANFTTIQWVDSTKQDLGKVKDGSVVEVSYRFKNSGNKNLIIEDVVAGCGCTVPEKPAQAFPPGEEGVIRAKFDSKGRLGTNEKYVTVTANTNPTKQHVLHFKVEVTN